jgi:hypothetical protein
MVNKMLRINEINELNARTSLCALRKIFASLAFKRTYTGAERKICPVGKFSEGAGLQGWRQRSTEGHRGRGIRYSVISIRYDWYNPPWGGGRARDRQEYTDKAPNNHQLNPCFHSVQSVVIKNVT